MNPIFWNGLWIGVTLGVICTLLVLGITPIAIEYFKDRKKSAELPKHIGG